MDTSHLDTGLKNAEQNIAAATSLAELDVAQKTFNTNVVATFSKSIGQLAPDERGKAGAALSDAKAAFEAQITPKRAEFEALEKLQHLEVERVDVSAYKHYASTNSPVGARHPLQVLQKDVADFFKSIGWSIAEGPEIESEWYNFDALNFGPDHPARQMQDTFYAEQDGFVMRTHTSPVQARSLIENGAPLYVACPGRVYRTDELDATHTPVFTQVEGLAVDKHLTMAHLKGTVDAFAKAMFGAGAKTRLRPSYFPFTEPSAEMDVWYPNKKGGAGWIEWGGCGMVNPNVLKSCGLDPDQYSGFAFGMGIERTLMLRSEIQDMHDIVEGDVRFSSQFGFAS